MTKLTYTISEAAAALSIGRTTIYKLISEQRLRTVKIGARTLIPADQIRALIEPKAA
jgi:excisionase family DNA binding protein